MTTVIQPPPAAPVAPSTLVAARRLPVLVGLAAFAVAAIVWIVAFSPALGVRTVSITGAKSLTTAQVRAAAKVGRGTPLIRLNTAAVRHRIEALPDVADAEVSVSYPSTLLIRITERTPVGYVVGPSGGYVLVDRFGVQYHQVAVVPSALPRFALPAGGAAVASGRAVATVAAALSATSATLLPDLAEIRATSPSAITLVLRDGRMVAWGSADRSDEKARLLPALLTQPDTHYDVSNPDVVIAR